MLKIYEMLSELVKKINGNCYACFYISKEGFLILSINWKEGFVLNERFDPIDLTFSKVDEDLFLRDFIEKANGMYRNTISQKLQGL